MHGPVPNPPPSAPPPQAPPPPPTPSPPPADWLDEAQQRNAGLVRWRDQQQRKADAARRVGWRRYWVNLGLLLSLVVAVAAFFWLHLEQLLTQTIVVGLPITFWGLYKLVQPYFPEGPLSEDQRSLGRRVLQYGGATEGLACVLLAVLILLATTSSLYLKYEDKATPPEVEVAVLEGGRPFRSNLMVSPADRIQGRPYLFDVWRLGNPTRLQFQVLKPTGYVLDDQWLGPGGSVHLSFPKDFKEKVYYVIRLVPGKGCQSLQPHVEGKRASVFDVKVSVNGQEAMPLDLSYDCVYFGAGAEGIGVQLAKEGPPARLAVVRKYLEQVGWKGTDLESKAVSLANSRRNLATKELQPGDRVRVVIVKESEEKKRYEFTVRGDAHLYDLVLEKDS